MCVTVCDSTVCVQVFNELVRLDEQELNNKYKIGVMYCKPGQTTEEEMYNNGQSVHVHTPLMLHVHIQWVTNVHACYMSTYSGLVNSFYSGSNSSN